MTAQPEEPMHRLLALMARLRDRERGCPWDVEQDFETIAPHTIEEAYEVADAIQRDDMADLKDELGDLLFQIVFHARMAEEAGHFSFPDVAKAISNKMIQRHPHVFGDASIATAAAQTAAWETLKAKERDAKAQTAGRGVPSVLDGVIAGLPALIRALKLQKRAARVHFDWPNADAVKDKIREELGEIDTEMTAGSGHDRLEDEVGDLLFVCVNLARHLGVDPESSLRRANHKFETRFRRIEALAVDQNRALDTMTLAEMDALWEMAKDEERASRIDAKPHRL
ncbi:MAG: nucleoside triphosphate pyrophosphohydrolase [Rhodospirillaceae bacterium]|nr:nucleoside triphosphate pyrophosphohydrolase [Rhodospirillaceae bacterium]